MVDRPRYLYLADPGGRVPDHPLEDLDRGEGRLTLEVLSWNLFHGRDHPPGDPRGGPDWRLLGRPVATRGHVLLNRNLEAEFGGVLADWSWDIALLQEVPVVWIGSLARVTGSVARFALTARNWMSPVTVPLWSRRPHLIGSWEGGSNLILVRVGRGRMPGRSGASTLRLIPERRRLHFIEMEGGPLIFNLHASTGSPRAGEDVRKAAGIAVGRSSGRPFVFGGDFNVSPKADPGLFELLNRDHDLSLPDGADRDSIDQVLVSGARGGKIAALPPELREVRDESTGLTARLSDHCPVVAQFDL